MGCFSGQGSSKDWTRGDSETEVIFMEQANGSLARSWPAGYHRIPFWLYSDAEVYTREQQRIFGGPNWCYVALSAEIPRPGDFKRSVIGDKPVVVTRDKEGGINVVVNRCAHRGVQFCRRDFGNTSEFMCPYHQWTYDLKGNLRGVPFRRGIEKAGRHAGGLQTGGAFPPAPAGD
jgi:salicylate 5-hydroxylase large subunit